MLYYTHIQREQPDPSDIGVCDASNSQDPYPEHQNSVQPQIRKSGRNRRPPSYLNSYLNYFLLMTHVCHKKKIVIQTELA